MATSKSLQQAHAYINEGQRIDAEIKRLELRKKEIRSALMPFVEAAGGVIDTDEYRASIVSSSNTSWKEDALVEAMTGAGLKPTAVRKIISKGKVTKPYAYLRIAARKEDEQAAAKVG